MNWYKTATKIDNLKDRNDLNKRIKQFQQIIIRLKKAMIRIPQDANGSRKTVLSVLQDKKLTSFPQAFKQLQQVSKKMLDNYDTAQQLLEKVIKKLVTYTEKMQSDRQHFSTKVYPEKFRRFFKKEKNDKQ